MEWSGLPVALGRIFPDHVFYAVPTPQEIESNPEQFPCDSFTSCLLAPAHEIDPPEAARQLVSRAAQEALGDRRREAADIVIVLDDLELANAAQPDRVARVFRNAAQLHLADPYILGNTYTYGRTVVALRERVSFHLIVPMAEAWLFADHRALTVAGVSGTARVIAEPDLEAFETRDEAYLAATEADCPCWTSTRRRKYRPKWLGTSPRQQHPKGYIQWLCLDGSAKNCTTYNESMSGSEALKILTWSDVLSRPGAPFRYLRALLADLSVTLGPPSNLAPITEDPDPPIPSTRLSARPRDHVLRNL